MWNTWRKNGLRFQLFPKRLHVSLSLSLSLSLSPEEMLLDVDEIVYEEMVHLSKLDFNGLCVITTQHYQSAIEKSK